MAIDRDPEAAARGRELAAAEPRFSMIEGRFGALDQLLAQAGLDGVDGIVADLGVSSFQLDEAARGFSFGRDGPLDMRMGGEGPSAADLVNGLAPEELARVFKAYGDEPDARRVARAIVARRANAPFASTRDLSNVVAAAKGRSRGHDPATLVFQALRIAVNDELGELERLLRGAERRLRPGGRLAIVTFHSGEDRIVKRFVDGAGGRRPNPSRHLPPPTAAPPATFAWVERHAVRPGASELAANPRARSAKLRVAVRLGEAEVEVAPDADAPNRSTAWRLAA